MVMGWGGRLRMASRREERCVRFHQWNLSTCSVGDRDSPKIIGHANWKKHLLPHRKGLVRWMSERQGHAGVKGDITCHQPLGVPAVRSGSHERHCCSLKLPTKSMIDLVM